MDVKDVITKVEAKARTTRREIENATMQDMTLPPASSVDMLWYVEKLAKATLSLQSEVEELQKKATKPKRKTAKKKKKE